MALYISLCYINTIVVQKKVYKINLPKPRYKLQRVPDLFLSIINAETEFAFH